ncbi:MAG TPA: signal peptidase I [Candidatus Merdibacter merdavium]|uniref:Signal peptidase I n=1 Tax=Candidatus Merdibacter merdavium TaxID=2838692 RepID=A0A9D2NNW6_9FIRM|nr:signal peptidase I [Candidatus Merdibacter merdavium]
MARKASKTGQTRIRRNLEAIMPLTRQIFSLVKYYVICVAVVLLLTNFVAKPVVIRGTSMNPTLQNFDFALSNRLSIVLGGEIERFDIVVVRSEEGEIVKRVVGIPGDTISYVNGVLTVNGTQIEEDYIIDDPKKHHADMDVYEETLGPDEYFLMGDNRTGSTDSRYFGPFHRSDIISKDMLVLFPFNRIRLV